MKYYSQLNLDGKSLFDVVWGEPLEDDGTLVVFKRGAKWSILDIKSGLAVKNNLKTKKAAIEWYEQEATDNYLLKRIETARDGDRYKEKVELLTKHKILHEGDRVTYIDVKDSVILDLIEYNPKTDLWFVQDEFHQFSVSPDRIIKVSEVN